MIFSTNSLDMSEYFIHFAVNKGIALISDINMLSKAMVLEKMGKKICNVDSRTQGIKFLKFTTPEHGSVATVV